MNPSRVIDIRGRRLGGQTPLICTPLVGRTRENVLAEAATVAAKKPDVIEWRVDFFAAIGDATVVLETATALRAAIGDTPLIFTRRSVKEGGEPIALDDAGVVSLYDAVGASGRVDFLDFEMGNDREDVRRVCASARANMPCASFFRTTTSPPRPTRIFSSSVFSKPSNSAPTSRRSR